MNPDQSDLKGAILSGSQTREDEAKVTGGKGVNPPKGPGLSKNICLWSVFARCGSNHLQYIYSETQIDL